MNHPLSVPQVWRRLTQVMLALEEGRRKDPGTVEPVPPAAPTEPPADRRNDLDHLSLSRVDARPESRDDDLDRLSLSRVDR